MYNELQERVNTPSITIVDNKSDNSSFIRVLCHLAEVEVSEIVLIVQQLSVCII